MLESRHAYLTLPPAPSRAPSAHLCILAILFFRIRLDKLIDRGEIWSGSPAIRKSPLAGTVPLLLGIITIMELAAEP